jgi:hypothetical protein
MESLVYHTAVVGRLRKRVVEINMWKKKISSDMISHLVQECSILLRAIKTFFITIKTLFGFHKSHNFDLVWFLSHNFIISIVVEQIMNL